MTDKPDYNKIIDDYFEKNKKPTLYDMIWKEVGKKVGYGSACDDFTKEIIDIVEKWIPPSHDTNSYEWEKCLKLMRKKLR